jgi:hypothetical protein
MPIYQTGNQTGADIPSPATPGGTVTVRTLTGSSAAQSDLYEPKGSTKPPVWTAASSRPLVGHARRQRREDAPVAANEHIGMLLRLCQSKSAELTAAEDPLSAGLFGGQLLGLLNEVWIHRAYREADWIEMLNLLHLMLAKQEFEALSDTQRRAIEAVFREDISTRTAGRVDVERMLQRLTTAGFDIWRGIDEGEIGP